MLAINENQSLARIYDCQAVSGNGGIVRNSTTVLKPAISAFFYRSKSEAIK